MKITGIVLTRGNKDLTKLKKSLDFCDEVIVLTSNFDDFSEARNKITKKAKGEWLFYLDDDEEVTPQLRDEMSSLITTTNKSFVAYAIPRKNIVFGKWMKYCGLWPDYVLRLIKKGSLISWQGKLHEQPKINGSYGYTKSAMIHHKHNNLSDMVEKTNKWSEIEARLMYKAGHPLMNVFRFASAGFREFWHRMIVQTAFLDGPEGIIYGMYQVFSRLISYSKLWEMQINKISIKS